MEAIGAEYNFSGLDDGFVEGRPLANHKMTPLTGTVEARSYTEKQPKVSSLDLPKVLVSSERREDFPNGVHSPQETKLNISSEGLIAGQEYASPGRCTSTSGKACQVHETVKAPDKVYLESAQHEIQMSASPTRREGFNGSKTCTNGELKQKTVNYGEKLVKICPVLDIGKSTHENVLASGKSLFRSNESENQAFSTVNGYDKSLRSNPLPNKARRNGETLVSEMTVSSPPCPCPSSEERHLPAHDSSKCWRKPLIDQIFITDVTSNFVTVTVKECLTDKGFFRQR